MTRKKPWPTKRGWKGWIKDHTARMPDRVSPEDFIVWLKELSADPKWKGRPTEWDDHQFRVSVQRELRRVR